MKRCLRVKTFFLLPVSYPVNTEEDSFRQITVNFIFSRFQVQVGQNGVQKIKFIDIIKICAVHLVQV